VVNDDLGEGAVREEGDAPRSKGRKQGRGGYKDPDPMKKS